MAMGDLIVVEHRSRCGMLEHDTEKWKPVLWKDAVQPEIYRRSRRPRAEPHARTGSAAMKTNFAVEWRGVLEMQGL
jgi:hypothetical protein